MRFLVVTLIKFITTREAMLICSYLDDKNHYKEKHDGVVVIFLTIKFYAVICR